MFFGFDETCRHIKNIYKKTFPLTAIIITPYIIAIWLLSVIVSLIAWFIGFWRCSDCNKVFPQNEKKYIYYAGGNREDGPNKYKSCSKCNKKREKRAK